MTRPRPTTHLWTIAEVAAYCTVTPRTVRKWIAAGCVTVVYVGPFHRRRIPEHEARRLVHASERTDPDGNFRNSREL